MTPILYFYDLLYQTTEQIMKKDILNYSATVMFRQNEMKYKNKNYL